MNNSAFKFAKSLAIFSTFLIFSAAFAADAPSRRELQIQERIKPIGEVYLTGEAPGSVAVSSNGAVGDVGQKTYQTVCTACHSTGLLGAPKYGDKGAWSARAKQGKATLYKHSIGGFKAMPAKGGCMQCSDDDIKAAVDYMLKGSK